MTKRNVVLLYGPPAAGKLSVGKELAKNDKTVLLDNHFFNNIVMPYVNVEAESLSDISKTAYQIRTLFLDAVKKHHKKDQENYVFTNVLFDCDDDYKSVNELETFAKEIDADFIPIKLECSYDCLCKRLDTPERKQRLKLTDKNVLKDFLDNNKFAHVSHKNEISIDVSEKSLAQTVDCIKTHIRKLS